MALSAKEAQRVQYNRTKEPQTPSEKTPLRLRRLSIENCNITRTDNKNSMKPEDKSGAKSPSFVPRSRRLSLEGAKSIKKDTVQTKVITDVSKPLQFDSVSKVNGVNGHFSNSSSKLDLHTKAPRSPTSISYHKRVIKIDCGPQVHPETPEAQRFDKNDAYRGGALRSDVALFSTDFQTPNVITNTNGKGSHIRRSLRTIGKLINGPEKRWVATSN